MTTAVQIIGLGLLAAGPLLATIGLYGMLRHPGIFNQAQPAELAHPQSLADCRDRRQRQIEQLTELRSSSPDSPSALHRDSHVRTVL